MWLLILLTPYLMPKDAEWILDMSSFCQVFIPFHLGKRENSNYWGLASLHILCVLWGQHEIKSCLKDVISYSCYSRSKNTWNSSFLFSPWKWPLSFLFSSLTLSLQPSWNIPPLSSKKLIYFLVRIEVYFKSANPAADLTLLNFCSHSCRSSCSNQQHPNLSMTDYLSRKKNQCLSSLFLCFCFHWGMIDISHNDLILVYYIGTYSP